MAKFHILPTQEQASWYAFSEILLPKWEEITGLGLATGSTPLLLYGWMIWYFKLGKLSFANIKCVNLDEYVGLLPGHPQSYWTWMWDNLFKYVDVKSENWIVPFGGTTNPSQLEEICLQMEKRIEDIKGVTWWILGMGKNAHVAFIEPPADPDGRYSVVELSRSTIEANSRFFKDIEEVPTRAISAGIKTIMEAKHLLQLAFGSEKAWAVAASVLGPKSVWVPSSLLQDHPDWHLVVDEEAGAGILKHLAERKIRPKEEGVYVVVSDAGITHQVTLPRSLASKYGILQKTSREEEEDLR